MTVYPRSSLDSDILKIRSIFIFLFSVKTCKLAGDLCYLWTSIGNKNHDTIIVILKPQNRYHNISVESGPYTSDRYGRMHNLTSNFQYNFASIKKTIAIFNKKLQ